MTGYPGFAKRTPLFPQRVQPAHRDRTRALGIHPESTDSGLCTTHQIAVCRFHPRYSVPVCRRVLIIPKYPAIPRSINMSDSCPVLSPHQSLALQAAPPSLILASGSRIRLSLLREAGLLVAAKPAPIDEDC